LVRAGPFVVFVVVYVIAACNSHLNLGYRHLLPILPPLFALVGGLESAGRRAQMLAWLLVAWLAAENVAARPFYLAYFNEAAGGRAQGYRRLADSNVDWGQDQPAFVDWVKGLRAAGDQAPVYLSFFGVDSAARNGVDAPRPFSTPDEPVGGWYCYSASALVAPSEHGLDWGARAESLYQDLLSLRDQLRDDPRRSAQIRILQQQRLAAGLWQRTPDVNISGSILAYRLAPDDVMRYLYGPPPTRPVARGER
jgi:hypothetical protein